jgi:hypothetical protein
MERWVENTFRTIGILLLSAAVRIVSGVLLLLSMCAYSGASGGGTHTGAAMQFFLPAVAVFVVGIFFIVKLARGLFRSINQAIPAPQYGQLPVVPQSTTHPSAELTATPDVQKTIQQIVIVMIVQVVVGYLGWLVLMQLSSMSGGAYAPKLTFVLVPFILSHLPYAILGVLLLTRPSVTALTFTLVVTTISLLRRAPVLFFLITNLLRTPGPFALSILGCIFEGLIIAQCFKALQKSNARPQPATVAIAVVVSIVYFVVLSAATPALYRMR